MATVPATEDRPPDAWAARRRVVQPPSSGVGRGGRIRRWSAVVSGLLAAADLRCPTGGDLLVSEPSAADQKSFKMGALIGRNSGESFQQAFHGPTSADIPPSEGQPVVATSCVKD